jgi:hypothetical protein
MTVAGHPARYTGVLSGPFHFTPPGITLAALSDRAVATKADWQRAFRACFQTGRPGCVATRGATVALGTADGPAGFPSPSGKLFDHSPAFVITWDPGTCTTIAATQCRVVDIVPTASYTVTYAFEISATAKPPTSRSS